MARTRMTRQRAVILSVLRNVESHPTADELYGMVRERLPRISLGTVYRNLELLARTGEILCLDTAGARKHFDGNPLPHHHVRCARCGRIGDVAAGATPSIENATARGFRIQGVELEFVGLCHKCGEI